MTEGRFHCQRRSKSNRFSTSESTVVLRNGLQFESEETVSGNISRRDVLKSAAIGVAAMGMPPKLLSLEANDQDRAILEFIQPPDDARPWVYWYFMDGHLTRRNGG